MRLLPVHVVSARKILILLKLMNVNITLKFDNCGSNIHLHHVKQVDWHGIGQYLGMLTNKPDHEKTCLMSYANNKGADQPAHPLSLISAFVVSCLDSIISLDSIAEISRL